MDWSFLHYKFWHIEVWEYLAALASILGGFILQRVTGAILHAINTRVQKGKNHVLRAVFGTLERPLPWLFVVIGLTLAFDFMPLPHKPINFAFFAEAFIDSLFTALIIWALVRLVHTLTEFWKEHAATTKSKLDDQLIPIVRKTLKVFVVIVGAVIIIQRLGYSAESLIAGLGIGSLAFALAAKDTIANLFGSLVIFIDHPFHIKDWVEIGDVEGTVEEINLRTTRIRTFANSLITIPNQKLTTSAITNWSAMKKRRIKLTLPLSRQCTASQLTLALEEIRKLIVAEENIHQNAPIVNLNDISEKGYGIYIYIYAKIVAWDQFMLYQEKLIIKIIERLEQLGIRLGVPTQDVQLLPKENT
jgi:MscS family membrane protein